MIYCNCLSFHALFRYYCPLDAYSSTKPADWRVVLGEHHLVDKEVFEQSRDVEAIYLHPKYKSMFLEGIYDTPPDYDIGKLRSVVLKRPQTMI